MKSSPVLRHPWALFLLPVAFVAIAFGLRHRAGPEWMWRHLDPDYFYLFDGLNIATLTAPGHVAHPGVPLMTLAAAVIRALHPFTETAAVPAAVMANPEGHLFAIAAVQIILLAAALLFAGWLTRRVTGSLALAVLVQLGPLLSMLTVKFALRVKPEALLVTTLVVMAAVMISALDDDRLKANRLRYAIGLGLIAGCGAALKITAAPLLGLLPVFLLGQWRAVAVFWTSCVVGFFLFFLPAIGELDTFLGFITTVSTGSGAFGLGPETAFDPLHWLNSFRRMLGRTAVSAPLMLSLVAMVWAWRRQRRGAATREGAVRAVAGISLGVVVLAAFVAKQPSGHYMIPAYALGGTSLALSLYVLTDPRWWPGAAQKITWGLAVIVGALMVAQGASLVRFDAEQAGRHDDAQATKTLLEAPPYAACAQVSFFPSSDPAFALLMGDAVTGSYRGAGLAPHIAKARYFIRDWWREDVAQVRDARGPIAVKDLLAQYPCTIFRGGHSHRLENLWKAEGISAPIFDATCSRSPETLYMIGRTCP